MHHFNKFGYTECTFTFWFKPDELCRHLLCSFFTNGIENRCVSMKRSQERSEAWRDVMWGREAASKTEEGCGESGRKGPLMERVIPQMYTLALPKRYTGLSLPRSTRARQQLGGEKEVQMDRKTREGVEEINIHPVPNTWQTQARKCQVTISPRWWVHNSNTSLFAFKASALYTLMWAVPGSQDLQIGKGWSLRSGQQNQVSFMSHFPDMTRTQGCLSLLWNRRKLQAVASWWVAGAQGIWGPDRNWEGGGGGRYFYGTRLSKIGKCSRQALLYMEMSAIIIFSLSPQQSQRPKAVCSRVGK